ncbi:MAG: DNA mismatch repair protein, partial [Halobacteriaceae archaeon]
MRLEDYWGVGPKTADLLASELGVERAVEAIESADGRALVDAGLSRGRATRILRHAGGGEGMAVLATRDARDVYKSLVELAAGHALTDAAADRVRVLTPLRSREAMEARLDEVLEAVDSWRGLDGPTRRAVEAAYDEYGTGGERAAVETAMALQDAGVEGGVFAGVAALDRDTLAGAAEALSAFDGDAVAEGVDDRLDDLRATLAAVEELELDPAATLEAVRSEGVGRTEEFREMFLRYVTDETGASAGDVRESMPADAVDAADFVAATLRELSADYRERVADREEQVEEELRETVEGSRETVEAAVEATETVALRCSLARFAIAYDLVRPDIVADRDVLAVRGARNLDLVAGDASVQPVDYAVGDHGLDGLPSGDRVAVLTGANSGGKTTLLETLCSVALLAHMG